MKTYICIYKPLTLFFLLIALYSCEDRIEEVVPEDLTADNVVFSNEELALGAVVGIYSSARQDNVLNGELQLSGEWQADNVDFSGTFLTYRNIRDYTTLSTNVSINQVWDDNYETIGSCNLVIDNVPLTPNAESNEFTTQEKNQAITEARFMRALIYLNISSFFGQPLQVQEGENNLSVPLVVSSEFGLEVPRATLGEIYNFIESELLDVASSGIVSNTRSTANPGAAKALLARLYLYQERFAEAAEIANEVIQDDFYALAEDYSFFDQPTSSEHIFTLVNNEIDGQTGFEGFSGLTNPNGEGRGDAPFSDNLLDAYNEEPDDLRFTSLTQIGPNADGDDRVFTTKFDDGVNNSDDAPVIRITEMYLTRAEANFRANSSVGATPLQDINTLRDRAGLSDLASVDLDIILNERRKELAFEGQRRMDLLRNNLNLRRPGQNNVAESAPGSNKTIYPIPQAIRDLSPFLEQNPGY